MIKTWVIQYSAEVSILYTLKLKKNDISMRIAREITGLESPKLSLKAFGNVVYEGMLFHISKENLIIDKMC